MMARRWCSKGSSCLSEKPSKDQSREVSEMEGELGDMMGWWSMPGKPRTQGSKDREGEGKELELGSRAVGSVGVEVMSWRVE